MSSRRRNVRTFEPLPIVLVSALLHVIAFASLGQLRFTRPGESRASDSAAREEPSFVLLDLRPTRIATPEPELQAPEPEPVERVEPEPPAAACADAPEIEPEPTPEPVPAVPLPATRPQRAGPAVAAALALALKAAGSIAAPPAKARAVPSVPAPRPTPGARLLRSQDPHYPGTCIQRGIEGSVLCRMHVDARGTVIEVEIVESSGNAELDRAAQRALAQWRFEPPRSDGRALESRVLHRVTFRLRGRR